MSKSLHEILKNLTWIVGKWKSVKAEVSYPTMKTMQYEENLEFSDVGQPLLKYTSVTRNPQTKMFMHLENGFLRIADDKCTLAFLTAVNMGLSTLEEGYVEGEKIVLASACLGTMKFSKQIVLSIKRCYRINDKGELEYTLLMETPQVPLTKHVEVTYEKQCGNQSERQK